MRRVRGCVGGAVGSIADTSVGSVVRGVGNARDNTPGAGLRVIAVGGGRVGVHGRGGVVRGRVVGHGHRLGRGRVGGRACSRHRRSGAIARRSGGVVDVRLDNNGLNLLGDNSACRATVLVGAVAVDGSVLVALLAPAPAQETGQNGGGKGSEDNTGNSSARDVVAGRDDNRGGANGARTIVDTASGGAVAIASGRRLKGLGTLAGTVLVGVTVGILQIG